MAISPQEVKRILKGRTRKGFIKSVEKATGKKYKDIHKTKLTVKELKLGTCK